MVARRAHNPQAAGSNPALATKTKTMSFDLKIYNALKNCSICGQPVAKKGNATSEDYCEQHLRMWKEYYDFGQPKRKRKRKRDHG